MDEEAIIKSVLERNGFKNVKPLDPLEYFDSIPELAEVHWRPDHLYQADEVLWAVDRLMGQEIPEFMIESIVYQMKEAHRQYPTLLPCFLVYPESDQTVIMDACAKNDIAIMALIGAQFDFLPLGNLPTPTVIAPPTYHLPIRLVRRITQLNELDQRFGAALSELGKEYLEHAEGGLFEEAGAATEEALLRHHFEKMARLDEEFMAPLELLDVLRHFESRIPSGLVRDHFFHAFHNFLLGCLVLDQAYPHFAEFASRVMGDERMSPEYVWLLTALFHDIGYPLELMSTIQRMYLGEDYNALVRRNGEALNGDRVVRTTSWASAEWVIARLRLVSLWDYLRQENPEPPWSPEKVQVGQFPRHTFDQALLEGFLKERCHGVSSCMRLVTELQRRAQREPNDEKRDLLLRHIFVAGLSIPFHHSTFRQVLRGHGILQIDTARFPFASLLAFIDSIQDDRRAFELSASGPDLLHDVVVESDVVFPMIELTDLTEEQVRQIELKRPEALDVQEFLYPGGLSYTFPANFLGL